MLEKPISLHDIRAREEDAYIEHERYKYDVSKEVKEEWEHQWNYINGLFSRCPDTKTFRNLKKRFNAAKTFNDLKIIENLIAEALIGNEKLIQEVKDTAIPPDEPANHVFSTKRERE